MRWYEVNGYFYHGIEFYPGTILDTIKKCIKIMDEGIELRGIIRGFSDENMNHICLYHKNDEYDYQNHLSLLHSARGGWIDGQFVFIIDSDIDAKKAEIGRETDLIDEWRCYEKILPEKFVGVALPFDGIQELLNEDVDYNEEDKDIVRQYWNMLIEKVQSMGLILVNSDDKDFTDNFDNQINNKCQK